MNFIFDIFNADEAETEDSRFDLKMMYYVRYTSEEHLSKYVGKRQESYAQLTGVVSEENPIYSCLVSSGINMKGKTEQEAAGEGHRS